MRPPRSLAIALLLLLSILGCSTSALAREPFRVCWSAAAGGTPWGYAAQKQIVGKWARKYRIRIDVVQVTDYNEALQQYSAGQFDGCTMNNLDALTHPATRGVDSTALLIGGFSNGNDGILMRGKNLRPQNLKGQTVALVPNSTSHYLLTRALQSVQLSEDDVTLSPVAASDLATRYASGDVAAVATWNPLLTQLQAANDSSLVFNSHHIPGEILHLMVVNTETLRSNPALGRALTGAWFETVKLMKARDDKGAAVVSAMARIAGMELADYQAQLSKTRTYVTPRAAVRFAQSADLPAAMQRVAEFAFSHHLLGKAISAQSIGMSFANGVVGGSPANIKLRFEPAYMQLAADGTL